MGNNLSEKEIFDRVKKVIEKLLQMGRDQSIRPTSAIAITTDIYADLGIDSLEVMDLVAAIEREFGISVVPEEMVRKTKVQDIVDAVSTVLREA